METLSLNQQDMTIGIIGTGNMGSAIAEALSNQKSAITEILVYDRNEEKALSIAEGSQKCRATTLAETVRQSDFLFVAVKPDEVDNLVELASQAKDHLKVGATVISIMAGVRISSIQKLFGTSRVVRSMPHLGSKLGKSFTFWKGSETVTNKNQVKLLLQSIGQEIEVDKEDAIDVGTAACASAIGLFFDFIAGIKGLASKHFSSTQNDAMISNMLEVALEMLASDGRSAEDLCTAVTSKNGTTHAARKHFNTQLAMEAAYQRAKQIGEENDRAISEKLAA